MASWLYLRVTTHTSLGPRPKPTPVALGRSLPVSALGLVWVWGRDYCTCMPLHGIPVVPEGNEVVVKSREQMHHPHFDDLPPWEKNS